MVSVRSIGILLCTFLVTGAPAWAMPATGQFPTAISPPSAAGAGRHLAVFARYRYRYEAPKEKSHEQPPRMRNLLEALLLSEIHPPGVQREVLTFTKDPLLTRDARLREEPWLRAIDSGIDDIILIEATFRLALLDEGGIADLSGVVRYVNVAENQVVQQKPFGLREEITADSPTGFEVRQLFRQTGRAYSPKDLAAALLAAAERRLKARMGELVAGITATYAPQSSPTLHDPILIETLWQGAQERVASTGNLESAKDFIRLIRAHAPELPHAAWEERMRRVREAAAAHPLRGGSGHTIRQPPETAGEDQARGMAGQAGLSQQSAAKGIPRSRPAGPEHAGPGAPTPRHSRAPDPIQAPRTARSRLDVFRGIRLETPLASVRQRYRLSQVASDRRAPPVYTIDFDPGKDPVQSIRLVAPDGRITKMTVLFSRDFGQMRHWAFPTMVQFFSAGYGRRPATTRGLVAGTRQVASCAEWDDGETTVTLNRFDDIGVGHAFSPPLLVLTISRPSQAPQGGILDGCRQWGEIAPAP